MTPWQPSATFGVNDPENDGAAARRHLYRSRNVDAEWAEDRYVRKLKRRVLDVRWVGDMYWRWARKCYKVSGGRFNYLYWVGEDTRWGSERSISGCLLGHEVGVLEPGGQSTAKFDIGLTVRARDGMYERGDHSGMAILEPTLKEKSRAWRYAAREGRAIYHFLGVQDWWLPPTMLECVHAPGKVAVRTRYSGVLLPHGMHGGAFVHHVGRVCDKRRGRCPYADKHPLDRQHYGSSVMMVADIRQRVGNQGANRGKCDPFMKTGKRRHRITEGWGPPLFRDMAGYPPEDWESC